jgi:hypothetical protein
LICTNAEKIKLGKIPKQLQPFLQGLKKDSLTCTLYNIWFLFRRALTAMILVMAQDHPYFQCCFLVILSLINISYQIMVKPFELKKDNYIEVFNEGSILVSAYMMCIFLDKQSSQEFLKLVGWSFMGLTFINVGLNAVACYSTISTKELLAFEDKDRLQKSLIYARSDLRTWKRSPKLRQPTSIMFRERSSPTKTSKS